MFKSSRELSAKRTKLRQHQKSSFTFKKESVHIYLYLCFLARCSYCKCLTELGTHIPSYLGVCF